MGFGKHVSVLFKFTAYQQKYALDYRDDDDAGENDNGEGGNGCCNADALKLSLPVLNKGKC